MGRKRTSAVDNAVADLRKGLFPSITAAAQAYRVSKSTVRDRYNGTPDRQISHRHEQILSLTQEEMLVRWSINLKSCGRAPTHA